MRTEFLSISILRVASGPRVKLAGCESALAPLPPPPPPRPQTPVVYSTDRSNAVVPVLVLLFVALWFVLQGYFLCLALRYSVLVFFGPFGIALPRLGKRELILVLFVRLSICACLVSSISSSSWCLGRAAVYDCGTPWIFLLLFFLIDYYLPKYEQNQTRGRLQPRNLHCCI